MKHLLFLAIFAFLFAEFVQAQSTDESTSKGNVAIIFEPGLLIGNPQSIYPLPFSTHVSLLATTRSGLFSGGLGTGAEIIGKTFMPLFADFRIIPLSTKPIFLYGKGGFAFCTNQSDHSNNESVQNYYYSYLPQPHYLYSNNETSGGLLFESGMGVFINRAGFKTTVCFGYRHQQTHDLLTLQNDTKKTFENRFNRIVFRVGFWF